MADRICVALTAFNEEDSIYNVASDFLAQPGVRKVIVVDNNSSDKTAQKAKEAGAAVVKENRQGYGYACIRGLRECLKETESDVFILAEGDSTFIGSDVHKLMAYIDDVDMVLGNRMTYALVDKDSQQDHFFSWGNLFLAKIIQLRFMESRFGGKARLTDVGCTMRAIRREALEKIIDRLTVGSDHFSPHMTVVALSRGLSVVEIPLRFKKRVGESKGASGNKWKAIRVGLKMAGRILTDR